MPPEENIGRDIVVIGASAGGVEALGALVAPTRYRRLHATGSAGT